MRRKLKTESREDMLPQVKRENEIKSELVGQKQVAVF